MLKKNNLLSIKETHHNVPKCKCYKWETIKLTDCRIRSSLIWLTRAFELLFDYPSPVTRLNNVMLFIF